MGYKHFIFDVDGTLVNNEYALLNAWKDTFLEVQGKLWDTKDLTFALGIPGEDIMKKAGAEYSEEAFELWRTHLQKYRNTIKLFDNMQDTLEKLKGKGKQLGIITSKTHAEFDGDTVIQSIKYMFEVIICASDSPRPKPFGDPIITYMEKTGTTEKDVIYIGDSTYDFECAQNANVDFGWAAWGDSQIAGIDSKYKFSKPEEILTLC